ncbi:MAG: cyclic nucleotide-binding domain-containing protein [Alphaproteobacteria bacterium]|nr:cyclic nucleotide-binding domain-containing protein [Alphaproteobacteria bacterium]
MFKTMYGFVWAYSKREQIIALILTLVSFPFLYFSFDLPKTIINKAIKDPTKATDASIPVPHEIVDVVIFGYNFTDLFGFTMERLPYLFLLCGLFLILVCINGMFKMRINTFSGVMAERLLRRLRYILIERTLRFPIPQFQKTSAGEVVTMVTAEVEPFGDAIVLPVYQGGMFLTVILFLFVQDPMMGIAATALVPLQGYIIPKMQRKINKLGKERVRHVRSLSNRVGEVVIGVQDVRVHDNTGYVLSDISRRLGQIFWVRLEIFQRKFFMKFVNNFINQMTPFLFYGIGGYLVLYGELSLGALVAALAAYKELAAPWKELLNWYQRLADSNIKYEQLIGQFEPDGMLDEALVAGPPKDLPKLVGTVQASGLTWADEDGMRIIDNSSFSIETAQKVSITTSSGTAKDVLAQLLARILMPTAGSLVLGGHSVSSLHQAAIGSRIGYVSGEATFFAGSIAENLLVGLNRTPPQSELDSEKSDKDRLSEILEAVASGNSPYSHTSDWVDYLSAGVATRIDLMAHTTDLLNVVELEDDFYALGLRMTVDSNNEPDLTEKMIQARSSIREILDTRGMDDLVQPYDIDRYNTYASVAGNIIFGKPQSDEWQYENWANNPIIRELMTKHKLVDDFYEIGLRCAALIVDLFKDLPPGHPFFDQYSFVSEELLPDLKLIARKSEQRAAGTELDAEERRIVLGLPFKLTVQRHRLGLIDEAMQKRLLAMRHDLRKSHLEVFEPGGGVEPYRDDKINQGLSILDNILFGRIVHGRADALEKVSAVVREVSRDLGIEKAILRTALNFQVGIGGGRLSSAQRQKLNLVRSILKNPDIMIIADGLSNIDPTQRSRIAVNLSNRMTGVTQIWIGTGEQDGISYDRRFEIKSGRVSEISDTANGGATTSDQDRQANGSNGDDALNSEARSLRELPLFANLDATKLKFLAFTSERLTYNPGEILMRQGEDGEDAFVILKGAAEVVIETNGKEQVLFELGANKLVGELALLCDSKRTATVRAREKTTALRLNREVFSEMARQDSHFAFEMTRDLGRRLILTTSELNRARNELVHHEEE